MDIYLPIAGQSVNALLIVVLGFIVGLLSGMFGVGGGFLTTPLLIFYGIPPTVAVASATTQITGASVSGAMVHMPCRSQYNIAPAQAPERGLPQRRTDAAREESR